MKLSSAEQDLFRTKFLPGENLTLRAAICFLENGTPAQRGIARVAAATQARRLAAFLGLSKDYIGGKLTKRPDDVDFEDVFGARPLIPTLSTDEHQVWRAGYETAHKETVHITFVRNNPSVDLVDSPSDSYENRVEKRILKFAKLVQKIVVEALRPHGIPV